MKPAALLSLAAVVAMAPCAAWSADPDTNPIYAERTELAQRRFGDVQFVMGAGRAMKWLEMYSAGALLGVFRDFAVDEIIASPDGKHFLALSNSSYSSMAFAVIDRKGHVTTSSPHGSELNYCRRTNWGIGEWVDARSPRAVFSMEKNQMTSPVSEFLTVSVRGCDGKTVLLGRAPPPEKKVPGNHTSTTGTRIAAAANANGEDRSTFFIGNTIANLRGLDPSFGSRTLTLIEGRRPVSTSAQQADPVQEPARAAAPDSDSAAR